MLATPRGTLCVASLDFTIFYGSQSRGKPLVDVERTPSLILFWLVIVSPAPPSMIGVVDSLVNLEVNL